jgi:hypothetical protein
MVGESESIRLAESLKNDPNVYTVGHTVGTPIIELIVYLRKTSKNKFPETFEGFPVKVKVMGQIKPAETNETI